MILLKAMPAQALTASPGDDMMEAEAILRKKIYWSYCMAYGASWSYLQKLHHDLFEKRLDPSIHSSTNKLSFPGEGCNYTTYQGAAVLLWDSIKSPQIVYITIC